MQLHPGITGTADKWKWSRMKQENGGRRTYNRIKKCLRTQAGMTLTEMLAAVLILSMTAVAMAGGVVAVKDAYRKTSEKAEAQQVLASTAELITDFLSDASEVRSAQVETDGPEFFSAETGSWMRLGAVPYRAASGTQEANKNHAGICKIFVDDGGSQTASVPLLSDGGMAGLFYTDFDTAGYTYADGCFTVKNIRVYYKQDAGNPDRTPVAELDSLTVRAVNLEGKDE